MAELLDFTKPHVLRNAAEYNAAIRDIEHLLDTDPPPHSEAYERLEFLSVLVQAYEETHFPLEALPTPQDVVDFMLEQKGLSRADLAPWLGGKSRVAAFFHGVRPLSLGQIEALRAHLGIPADLLMARKPRSLG
jgi:HTH-type transcriptional regulator/antitoxin HigA